MNVWKCVCLLAAAAGTCPPADGSSQAPFVVDAASLVTPGAGSTCAPYLSLENALSNTSSLSNVVISLQSAVLLPASMVQNTLTIQGNGNAITLSGTVQVLGSLTATDLTLLSLLNAGFALDVPGSLLLDKCTITDFATTPISAHGAVTVTDSLFQGNRKGVFSILQFKGSLAVSRSTFRDNANEAGAVFFVSPVAYSGATAIWVEDCEFSNNGALSGNSVVLLNDLNWKETALQPQTISFARCRFKSNKVTPFHVSTQVFAVTIDSCSFDSEPGLITGSLTSAKLTLSNSTISNSAGPLVTLTLSGTLNITRTNVTNVSPGPVVYARGKGTDRAFVFLSHLEVSFIDNPGVTVYGTLVNAISASVWVSHVSVSNFTAVRGGIFSMSGSWLSSENLTGYNGSAPQTIVGEFTACAVEMNNTVFDLLRSRGTMTLFSLSTGVVNSITFRSILGFWDTNLLVYTTNFFLCTPGTDLVLDNLEADLAVPGTTLLYIRETSNLILTNSRLVGPLGMGVFTVLGGSATVQNTTFHFTTGRTIAKLLLGGRLEFDLLQLRNLTLTSPIFSVSAQSRVYVQQLLLTDVHTLALVKGQDSQVTVETAQILSSSIEALVHFSIAM